MMVSGLTMRVVWFERVKLCFFACFGIEFSAPVRFSVCDCVPVLGLFIGLGFVTSEQEFCVFQIGMFVTGFLFRDVCYGTFVT